MSKIYFFFLASSPSNIPLSVFQRIYLRKRAGLTRGVPSTLPTSVIAIRSGSRSARELAAVLRAQGDEAGAADAEASVAFPEREKAIVRTRCCIVA